MCAISCLSALRLTAPDIAPSDTTVRRAFALVSLCHPFLGFEGWTRYLARAQQLERSQAGVVAIEDARGYLHALFRYFVQTEPSLADSQQHSSIRMIRLHDLVFAELPGTELLARIAAEGEALAISLSCRGVIIELPAIAGNSTRALNDFRQTSSGVVVKILSDNCPPDGQDVVA